MQLKARDSPELLQLVAGWLSERDNYQWLDFGDGRQLVSPRVAQDRHAAGTYVLRLFTSDVDERPIGVVALGNVNPHFKTANVWVVLGDKSYAGQGYASRATSKMLTLGFRELALNAIHTWIVEHNPSVHVARRVGFRWNRRSRNCRSTSPRG